MQWVSTKLKGKLAEHEPVDRDIPLFLPEQLVDFLFNDAGVHIDEDDVQQYWAHARPRVSLGRQHQMTANITR